MLSDVCANALNGLLPLREHRGKEVPDVDHLLPDFEGDIYTGRFLYQPTTPNKAPVLGTTATTLPNRLVRPRNSTDATRITPYTLARNRICGTHRRRWSASYLSLDQYKHEAGGGGKRLCALNLSSLRAPAKQSMPP